MHRLHIDPLPGFLYCLRKRNDRDAVRAGKTLARFRKPRRDTCELEGLAKAAGCQYASGLLVAHREATIGCPCDLVLPLHGVWTRLERAESFLRSLPAVGRLDRHMEVAPPQRRARSHCDSE